MKHLLWTLTFQADINKCSLSDWYQSVAEVAPRAQDVMRFCFVSANWIKAPEASLDWKKTMCCENKGTWCLSHVLNPEAAHFMMLCMSWLVDGVSPRRDAWQAADHCSKPINRSGRDDSESWLFSQQLFSPQTWMIFSNLSVLYQRTL